MFSDHVRAKTFPIEFLRGTFHANIWRKEPDFISDSKFDAFVFCVIVPCLGVLSLFNVFHKGVMML